jgi:hypothetical protein
MLVGPAICTLVRSYVNGVTLGAALGGELGNAVGFVLGTPGPLEGNLVVRARV